MSESLPRDDKRDEDSADATARMLPCPSCGETDVDATFAAGVKAGEREERFYNAGCMVCGMTGPDSHTPRDAADRWNALPRTTPSAMGEREARYEKTLQEIASMHTVTHDTTNRMTLIAAATLARNALNNSPDGTAKP